MRIQFIIKQLEQGAFIVLNRALQASLESTDAEGQHIHLCRCSSSMEKLHALGILELAPGRHNIYILRGSQPAAILANIYI